MKWGRNLFFSSRVIGGVASPGPGLTSPRVREWSARHSGRGANTTLRASTVIDLDLTNHTDSIRAGIQQGCASGAGKGSRNGEESVQTRRVNHVLSHSNA